MRGTSLLTLAAALALLSLPAACSNGGGGDDDDDDDDDAATTPTATPTITPTGTASGTLRVTALALPLIGNAGGTIVEQFTVSLENEDGTDTVDDATVLFGHAGEQLTLSFVGAGTYAAGVNTTSGLATLAGSYALDVTRGSDFLTGALLDSPDPHVVTLTPAPALSTEVVMTWSPNSEPDVLTSLIVMRGGTVVIDESLSPQPDTGTRTIPASTFSTPATYAIGLHRWRPTPLAGPDSSAKIDFFWERSYSLP